MRLFDIVRPFVLQLALCLFVSVGYPEVGIAAIKIEQIGHLLTMSASSTNQSDIYSVMFHHRFMASVGLRPLFSIPTG